VLNRADMHGVAHEGMNRMSHFIDIAVVEDNEK
jgi:hypothetical protein